jgi:flagellar biosynthesis protein FliP
MPVLVAHLGFFSRRTPRLVMTLIVSLLRYTIASLRRPLLRVAAVLALRMTCYLVDPASSHMLVSKIKPCMCKYELIQTVKLRMAH